MSKSNVSPLRHIAEKTGWVELCAMMAGTLLVSVAGAEPLFGLSHAKVIAASFLAFSALYAAAVIFARQLTTEKFRFAQLLVPSMILGLASGLAFMTFVASQDVVELDLVIGGTIFFTLGLWPVFLLLLSFFPWVIRQQMRT